MQYHQLGLASDARRRPLDIFLEIGAAASRADVVVAWALALAIVTGISLLLAAS